MVWWIETPINTARIQTQPYRQSCTDNLCGIADILNEYEKDNTCGEYRNSAGHGQIDIEISLLLPFLDLPIVLLLISTVIRLQIALLLLARLETRGKHFYSAHVRFL